MPITAKTGAIALERRRPPTSSPGLFPFWTAADGSEYLNKLLKSLAFFQSFSRFFQLAWDVKCKFREMEFLETKPNFTSTKEKFVEVRLRPP